MLSEEEKREAHHYAQKLKYLKGALIFNGSGEEDFLYCPRQQGDLCLPGDGKKLRIPNFLSKDELADSLAYNSLKVRK
jgi:hypothetical protein